MAEHDGSPEYDGPDEPAKKPAPPRTTEDTVFPEAYRKFWRTLLGGWRRH
ncbi:hypothetical protein [Mycolicibacterium vinylchloridicum]|nr:hypothetical protein [Mycolicibacterium vinylchloridicum]